ncbi:MAG: hypothetical protein JNK02_05275 [Planctomycetes bacterium]|nr:hypothetical protein [Planctomycetota bacterium]
MQARARFLLPLALLAAACSSTSSDRSPAAEAADAARSTAPERPIAEIVEGTRQPEPIGALLTSLDQQMTAWNNLFLSAQTDVDRSKARTLEKAIMTTAHNRRQEIQEQLEVGPLNNRIVAAAALGFTRSPDAQSPLLAALDDDEPQVVASALLGLWLLGRADTPLDRILALMTAGETAEVRTNAALCLATLVKGGARAPSLIPTLRVGLMDQAPTVRAHCALTLAELGDTVSFQAIADMLNERTTLTVSAAARAVAFLTTQDNKLRGKGARALVSAWLRAAEPAKSAIYRAMVELSGTNYGSNEEDWTRWASRLP